jgi:LuxR family maltose regulon positive regulatory protein
VEHGLRTGDVDAAADLVVAATLPTFFGGHPDRLDRWLRALPDAAFERRPPIAAIAAWVHILNGRPEAADHMADIVERSDFTGPPGDGSASFASARAMLRALMVRHGPQDALDNAAYAASAEPPGSPWRSQSLWLLGSARLLVDDVVAADAAFAESVEAAVRTGATAVIPLASRASIAAGRKDWLAAERFARESREALTRRNIQEILAGLIAYAISARVAIHHGDLARGRDDLVRAQVLRPLASYAAPWIAVSALLELARAYLAISDPAGAQSVVADAEEILRRRPSMGTLTAEVAETRRRLGEASRALAGSSSLTAAELRLLPILSTHLTFQEIADRLFLSRHTVKTQAISIYGKLGASTRSEAVGRAVEIGLLEPFPGLMLTGRPT